MKRSNIGLMHALMIFREHASVRLKIEYLLHNTPTPDYASCAVRGKTVVVVVGKRFDRCSRFPVLDSGYCPRRDPRTGVATC